MCLLESHLSFDVLSYITPWQNHSTPLLWHVPALFCQSVGTRLRTRSLDTWCLVWKPQSQHAASDSCAGALGWCIDLALSVPRWVRRPFPEEPEKPLENFCPSAVDAAPFSLPNKRLLAALQGNNYRTASDSERRIPIQRFPFVASRNFDLIESHHTSQPSLCLNNMCVMRVEKACRLGGGIKNGWDTNCKRDQTRKFDKISFTS